MLRHDFRSDLRFGNSHRKRHGSRANCFAQFCPRAPNAKNSFARQPILLIWGMDLSTLANVATALTVLTGVVFGRIEMRRARREREETGRLRCRPGVDVAGMDELGGAGGRNP